MLPDQNLCSETKTTRDLFTLLKLDNGTRDDDVKFEEIEANLDNDEEEEEHEEEFSFMCGGPNSSPIAAEDAFINGQIKPFFPLFNHDLLFSSADSDGLPNLPMKPPVKKVFVETTEGETSSAAESERSSCEWSDRKAVEASPEICKKSNSTGFSKIWRFKDLLGRSNSDGRDAFVFLNNSHAAAEHSVAAKGEDKSVKKESTVKVKKGKTASLSAHEVYLKSKGKKEERRRRSYLPYRPELMGFFTNVNGGLSKNVHPF